jgi:hypothetical protein
MGRKGVSKRKKVKVKASPVSGRDSASGERKAENQPEQVTEKGKASPKGNKKH